MSPIRQELIAYSQQHRSDNQILRALLESNTWYAPAAYAADALGRTAFDRVIVSTRQEALPAGGMVYFTDFEAAQEANLPASFAGEIAGVDLFDTLDSTQVNRLIVNYGLPAAQTFYADSGAFPLLRQWSASIRLEQQLKAAAHDGAAFPFRGARQHPGFIVLVRKADNHLHTGQVTGLAGDCAIAFTAPDHFEGYWDKLDPETRESAKAVEVSGERLFAALAGSGLAGVMMNAGITIPRGMFQQIATA